MGVDKERIKKAAEELNELSKEFSLSHAVLATARKIENDGILEIDKENAISKQAVSFDNPYDILFTSENEEDISKKLEEMKKYEEVAKFREKNKKMAKKKIYIKVDSLPNELDGEALKSVGGARTFYEITENTNGKLIEHYDIKLPPNIPITKNEKSPKDTVRFLVGHELGHLYLHLKDFGKEKSVLQEDEASYFSEELARLRKEHLKEIEAEKP